MSALCLAGSRLYIIFACGIYITFISEKLFINMLNRVIRTIVVVAACMGASSATAQYHRVAATNGMTRQNTEITVYDYDYVDAQPSFPGGDFAMLRFINDCRRYPAKAYNDKIQGRVLCSFVVNVDGSISNATVMRGVEESLDREALRIINEMPRWEAGMIGGEPVPVYCIVPIPFRL